jgi:hypothetical protein
VASQVKDFLTCLVHAMLAPGQETWVDDGRDGSG